MSSTSDTPNLSGTTNTFVWAIIPLVFVFLTVMVSIFVYYRRRRLRGQNYELNAARQRHPSTRRQAAGHNTEPDEGLNELGEAPPPYTGKAGSTYSEPGDLEAGRSPPDYPAMPLPAVTSDRRTEL
ncbi:hypothetical protein HJFPF1_03870 [Paramyrothecium foliicola]|nr:hypothetical protein HJFPF1_03870 [Paramyrothecium foliicola]